MVITKKVKGAWLACRWIIETIESLGKILFGSIAALAAFVA
jgi:hypothetical protein